MPFFRKMKSLGISNDSACYIWNNPNVKKIVENTNSTNPFEIFNMINTIWKMMGQKEAEDITIDFQGRLIAAGEYMIEFATAFYKDKAVNPGLFLKEMAIESDVGPVVLRTALHRKYLPDVSDEDMENIPDSILRELAIKFAIFKKVHQENRQHAKWDVKNSAYSMYKENGIYVGGVHYEHDITGNIMYGYTGAAGGISEKTLTMMAGIAQKQMGTSDPTWTWEGSYFDDPRDQAAIRAGIYLFKNYGTNITPEAIKDALTKSVVPKHEEANS